MAKKAAKPKIVSAVGTASGGVKEGPGSVDIERAMNEAGLKAMEEGITDPNVIRDRKLAARAVLLGKSPPVAAKKKKQRK